MKKDCWSWKSQQQQQGNQAPQNNQSLNYPQPNVHNGVYTPNYQQAQQNSYAPPQGSIQSSPQATNGQGN